MSARFIHTDGFAQLSLIEKLEHCSISDIVIATVSKAAIGYEPLGIGHYKSITSENRRLLRQAIEYKIARQTERVEKSIALFRSTLLANAPQTETPVPSGIVPMNIGMDKLEFLAAEGLTNDRIDQYWPGDKYPGIADAVRRLQRTRRGEFDHIKDIKDTREFHHYNITLNMIGESYTARETGELVKETPAFMLMRTKVSPFNKAMRDLNREVVLLGHAPRSTEERQRIFDYATIRDMVACSFVYIGTAPEGQRRAQQATVTLTTDQNVRKHITFTGNVRDDYTNSDAVLRRTKVNFTPWHAEGEDMRGYDTAELQVTDIVNLIGKQELGLRPYDEYVEDRDKAFRFQGEYFEYSKSQRDNNIRTRKLTL
jgi:hypothetical protein